MKLYYAEVLNPRKACALAKHIAAPVEYVKVALAKGEHMRPAFRALNPNGKVPVLQDGDQVLWETDAILCHLAWHYGRDLFPDLWPRDARQIDIVRWFSWNQAHFNRCAGPLYFEHVIKAKFGIGPPDPAKVAEALANFRVLAAILDAHLETRAFLLGDQLSVADFAVAGTFPYAEQAQLPLQEFPALARYNARLDEIPAWRDPFPAVAAI